MKNPFIYRRRAHFYETDMMGIVHHANYLRYFEEARVAWLRERQLDHLHGKKADCFFSVLETQVKHLRPINFEEEVEVHLQAKIEGVRLYFRYEIWSSRFDKPVAEGLSTHAAVNREMRVIRPSKEVLRIMEREPWTET